MPVLQRIHIMGPSGSGKTSFAAAIAARRGIAHIELDALHWLPNWQERERTDFRARVAEALSAGSWVVDGNYSKVRDLVWARADTVLFLDYPLWLCFGRLLRRTLTRSLSGEELWGSNRESLGTSFFSRDSILLYTLRTYHRRRLGFQAAQSDPRNSRLAFLVFSNPRQAQQWLVGLAPL